MMSVVGAKRGRGDDDCRLSVLCLNRGVLWPRSSYVPRNDIISRLGVMKSTRALHYGIPQNLALRG